MKVPPNKDNVLKREKYVPAKHNPQENVRPGADDHKQHKSLPTEGHATYRRHHP
jgi:hypothetical protein